MTIKKNKRALPLGFKVSLHRDFEETRQELLTRIMGLARAKGDPFTFAALGQSEYLLKKLRTYVILNDFISGVPQKVIADKLGVSKPRVCQIIKMALAEYSLNQEALRGNVSHEAGESIQ